MPISLLYSAPFSRSLTSVRETDASDAEHRRARSAQGGNLIAKNYETPDAVEASQKGVTIS